MTSRDDALQIRAPWLAALLLGTCLGVLILGAGGRLAMRGVTLWEGRTHLYSLAGTLTVLAWGAGLGAAAGLVRVAIESGLRRARAGGRHRSDSLPLALWWAVSSGIALVLLTPWTLSRLVLFPPVVLAFLAAFETIWSRMEVGYRPR